jgi:WW domain-binding protein 4
VEVKGEEAACQDKQSPNATSAVGDAKGTAVPKWAPVKWKKAGDAADNRDGAANSAPAGDIASTEIATNAAPDLSNADADVKLITTPAIDMSAKEEPKFEEAVTPSGENSPSPGNLFRKRKAPIGGGASSRGRRF